MPAGHSDEAQFRALDQYALVAGRDVRARWPEPNGKEGHRHIARHLKPAVVETDATNHCDRIIIFSK